MNPEHFLIIINKKQITNIKAYVRNFTPSNYHAASLHASSISFHLCNCILRIISSPLDLHQDQRDSSHRLKDQYRHNYISNPSDRSSPKLTAFTEAFGPFQQTKLNISQDITSIWTTLHHKISASTSVHTHTSHREKTMSYQHLLLNYETKDVILLLISSVISHISSTVSQTVLYKRQDNSLPSKHTLKHQRSVCF